MDNKKSPIQIGIPKNPSKNTTTSNQSEKRKPPSPQDMISHYESQGLDYHEASVKVIEDLQSALFKVITSSRGRKDKILAETSRKIDNINGRLAIVDMKVDSKPGYGETFAIGVASGLTLKGVFSVWPHVVGSIGQIWSSVRSATKD